MRENDPLKDRVREFNYVKRLQQTLKKRVVIALIIVAIGCAWGIYTARSASENAKDAAYQANSAARQADLSIQKFRRESLVRRNQACIIFERGHLKDVQSLRKTYKYLSGLSHKEAGQPLNQFVIRELSRVEADARVDSAPNYCDQPGVGLPEPDPQLPPHKDFNYLLEQ